MSGRGVCRETLAVLAATGAALGLLAGMFGAVGDTGQAFAVAASVGFGGIAAIVLLMRPAHPYSRFGMANIVTTIRAGLTALIGALLFEAERLAGPPDTLAWLATATAAIALSLDGLDGYTARRRNETSRFGARFDMEIDALLILLLCGLLIGAGKVGLWAAAIGALRYLFVLAGAAFPWLDAHRLAPSRRRQTICVIQGVALCIALAPIVTGRWASIACAMALAALVYSFAVDIHRLAWGEVR